MARKGGKDRGLTQRKDRTGWWVKLYVNGRRHSFKCDTKSQAAALYGRLKAEQREGKYFPKPKALPFRRSLVNTYRQWMHAAAVTGVTPQECTAGSRRLAIKTPSPSPRAKLNVC